MKIHREGFSILIGLGVVLLVSNYLAARFATPLFSEILIVISVLLYILFAQFFRYPRRRHTEAESTLIAPADGKVVVIEKVMENEYLKRECIQVSIFMSPFNVHLNRVPISGTLEYYRYHPGKYLVAWHPKSSLLNERNTAVIRTVDGHQVLLRQIAGALAKRIRFYLKEGQPVTQNMELGFIKFGSRVDLFLPLDAKIEVTLGQKTKNGVTRIATLPEID